MCGITGFNWSDKTLIKKMTDRLSHRGPDDSGFYLDQGVSLGHRRLSILDLSAKGHQPMLNRDRSLAIIFNGEIWNYHSLKEDLISKGYGFKSSSDTEAILNGYAEYGVGIFAMLEGMFALAIWDRKKKRIVLARDEVGKKPLYYFHESDKLIFSSEIKSILSYEGVSKQIDTVCLSDYLTLRFSPGSRTMFSKIKKLPPGSYAVFEKSTLKIHQYRTPMKFSNVNLPDESKVDDLIAASVRKRLLSDVPIGVFLSGGLDSSAIVAYMSRFSKEIRTFSVAFDGATDESAYARLIAKKFGTKHKEIRLDRDVLKYLPEVIYHFDEPLADPAALPTFLLCKEVSQSVKVALSGEGGDEVFGGYQTFNGIPMLKKIHSLPYFIRSISAGVMDILSHFFRYPRRQMLLLLSEILRDKSIEHSFKKLFYFPFEGDSKKSLLPDAMSSDAFDNAVVKNQSLDVAAQKYYFREWLPNDLLMKADKMGMASGLEIRTPFLDRDLREYFAGLSYEEKNQRSLFRKTISKILPLEILRKKKQGFTLPLTEWFEDENTFNRILPYLQKLKDRNIFSPNAIQKIIDSPRSFRNEHRAWVLLNFEIWYEMFIEGIPYKEIGL